jgi:hypothetical protein
MAGSPAAALRNRAVIGFSFTCDPQSFLFIPGFGPGDASDASDAGDADGPVCRIDVSFLKSGSAAGTGHDEHRSTMLLIYIYYPNNRYQSAKQYVNNGFVF